VNSPNQQNPNCVWHQAAMESIQDELKAISENLRVMNGRQTTNESRTGEALALLGIHEARLNHDDKDRTVIWKKISAGEKLMQELQIALATARGVVVGAKTASRAAWAIGGAAAGAAAMGLTIWGLMK
jgi:hypothetical protein